MPHERRRHEGRPEKKENISELRLAKEDESLLVRPVSDIEEFKEMMGSRSKSCPNCGSGVDAYYFCSYCGTEFCSSCAENSREGNLKIFICPSCSKKNHIQ